jgi:hypothetical protein
MQVPPTFLLQKSEWTLVERFVREAQRGSTNDTSLSAKIHLTDLFSKTKQVCHKARLNVDDESNSVENDRSGASVGNMRRVTELGSSLSAKHLALLPHE